MRNRIQIKYVLFGLILLMGCDVPKIRTHQTLSYYLDEPAQIWEASFPLGNGRIGLMPDGGIEQETIVLNEISLWSGSKQDANNPQAYY